MNTCSWIMGDESECGERCEGNTPFCGSHNRQLRREEAEAKKQVEKRNTLIAKQREKAKQPRKTISKNPKDWSNTFLCSDGERVSVQQIILRKSISYKEKHYKTLNSKCEGCGAPATCHAHIIPQARCKVIGRTELIWDFDNFFDSCKACNLAVENPKGEAWKKLLNVSHCLQFMRRNDRELFIKFKTNVSSTWIESRLNEPHQR